MNKGSGKDNFREWLENVEENISARHYVIDDQKISLTNIKINQNMESSEIF